MRSTVDSVCGAMSRYIFVITLLFVEGLTGDALKPDSFCLGRVPVIPLSFPPYFFYINSVSDPYSFFANPDPDPVDPDPIGLYDQKLKKNNS